MSITIDEHSLLAEVDGGTTLADVEDTLTAKGLTLAIEVNAELAPLTVARWIADGMPGARSTFADPSDHVIAGLTGTIGGKTLDIRPGPRRAVGPDLVALFAGTGDRLGRVVRVWLRVHRRDAVIPSLPLPGVDLDPPISDAEASLVERISERLRSST